jgi:ribosome-binding factor A
MGASRIRPPSQRQLRVGEEIRHALTRVLGRGDLHDPLLSEATITITQVKVSPDLQNATFAMPLGGSQADEVIRALNRAAGFLRGQLGREVQLRHTPRLGFEPDRSFDRADEVERLLRSPRVRRDLAHADESTEESGSEDARDREDAHKESSGNGA